MVSFAALITVLFSTVALATSTPASGSSACSDVHLVFARGTGQPAGLGEEGETLLANLTTSLPGKHVSAYAVDYEADTLQTGAGRGATDMTTHVVSYAAQCPQAAFVLGGYSQGATVADIAIGIETILGEGDVIPSNLASRIKAVVTFGNPLGLFGRSIAKSSSLYASKSIEYCHEGDPVCGDGANVTAHLTYPSDSIPQAAKRAAALVLAPKRSLRGDKSA